MGKDQKSLDTSREIRQHLINKWGRIPKSVWKVDWSIKCIELYTKYSEQQKINEEKVGKDFALSGTGARHGQLSAFPQDILQFLVTFLTPEKLGNDVVVTQELLNKLNKENEWCSCEKPNKS
jgi:hypothetical protein